MAYQLDWEDDLWNEPEVPEKTVSNIKLPSDFHDEETKPKMVRGRLLYIKKQDPKPGIHVDSLMKPRKYTKLNMENEAIEDMINSKRLDNLTKNKPMQ